MKNTKKNPALRFPEFSGEWEVKKLGDLVEIQSGLSPSNFELLEKGKYPFLKVEELNNCQKYQYVSRNYIDFDKNLIPPESIIFPKRGAAILNNKVRITRIASQMDSNLMAIIPKKNKINTEFLFYKIYSEQLYKIADTSSIPQINNKHIEPYKIKIPEIFEQKKIADFLTQIDNRIEKLTKKKELLEKYKKCVMQKIFNQKIRFKDDNDENYSEWKFKTLENMLSIVIDNRGKTPPISKFGIPLIEVNAIGNRIIDYSKINKYVDEDTYKNWFRKYLTKGDILFSTVGATAICSIYDESIISAIAQNIVGLRFKNEDYNFMYYLLTERKNNNKFKEIEMSAVQPSVKVSQMIHLKFRLPCIEEQQKIANFLTEIDKKINLIEKQLNGTKQYKKGLLQQMFI